jgi:hypothetical protein
MIGDWVVRTKLFGRILCGALVVVAATVGPSAVAATPAPPINDAYLQSLNLNRPGSPLNRTDTLKDIRNTAGATVQTNILDPCGRAKCPHGPAELTNCHGVSYGKTVWYDFYPDADGQVRIRTSGFDNVIAVMPFNPKTALPDTGQATCVHQSHFPSEQLITPVQRGRAYTIQVGGVGNAGGMLRMLFDYFVPPAQRLTAQATLTAEQAASGLQLLGLSVATVKQAHVSVSCGGRCSPQTATGAANEKFPKLKGLKLPKGSKLTIEVTEPGAIGVYIQYDITAHSFVKRTLCLEPGSKVPQRSCH